MKAADLHLLPRLRQAALAAAGFAAAWTGIALAGTTDISNAPLFTSSTASVKPNIMFVLDDSGSMDRKYVPDEANQFTNGEYGYQAAQCNGVAYDSSVTYTPRVDYTGASLGNGGTSFMDPAGQLSSIKDVGSISSWPAAGASITLGVTSSNPQNSWYSNGQAVTVYDSASKFFTAVVTSWSSSTASLGLKVLAVVGSGSLTSAKIGKGLANTYFQYTGAQSKLNYSYDSSGNLVTSSTFYQECNSKVGSTPGSNVFTPKAVGASSTEVQNYANWYKYYSTRMEMMKTAMSLAFKGVDNRYRVGFTTISSTTASEGTKFLNIRDFDPTQKQTFYTNLFAANPSITTPLRGALAKAGQYYAYKAPSQTVDPVQYSCQRNFTILSTDGYWNTGYETSSYGPYQLDRTTPVGQQDGGDTLRPMFDGGSVTRTTTEKWTATVVTVSTTQQPRTISSSVVNSTTTQAPVSASAGQSRTAYEFVQDFAVDGSNMSRSSNVVTVTVAGGHGLVSGDVIDVTGGSTSSYRAGNVSITVVSATQFKYTANGSNGTASGTYTILPGGVSCSGGKAVQRAVTQMRDQVTQTTVYSSDVTTTSQTVTFTTTKTDVTPYTRVTKVVNGVTVSDTTTAGTLSSSSTSTTPVVSTGATTTAHLDNTPAPTTSTSYTNWTTTAAAGNVGTSCRSTVSSPSSATTGLPSTTGTLTTANPAATTGPTTTNGTAVVTVDSTNTTESAHTSSSVTSSSSGGTSDTLADVAMYYYKTDLRNTILGNCTGALGTDVCNDNVPGNTNDAAHSYGDTANWQHMTTFTLGLGASGLLKYDPNYLTQLSGDFFDITNSSKNWPAPVTSSSGGEPQNIDDLWHAAVNGRGQYFSAGDPTSLTNSLNSALESIKAVTGAASAASTSSLQPVQGDNDIYVAQFTTQKWVGDVLSYKIDPTNGTISSPPTWSAKAQLDTQTPSGRTIYYASPSGSSTLRPFTYANLSGDGYNGLFDSFCSKTGADGSAAPAQCGALSGTELTDANLGSNLVAYLRGDQTLSYYRSRANLLGDIINASPLFVGKPGFKYTENNYQTFVSDKANRQAVVLAAANDGMLHAFDRATGSELWAFIPTFVMKNMYKLADTKYADNHSYFVDGSPQMGDIYVGGAWKTIVVGGLNSGGRGYYALDVTDPAAPRLLWEFKNDDLGLSFGNPIITKRADGTWVVVFASGYNNVSPGDGNGHLFVLNANTGTLLTQIKTYTSGTTPAGTAATPSGLARINPWVDSELANQAKRFYGGDMLGNLWRFDLDGNVEPNGAALLLARLTSPDGTAQPISVKPALAEVNYNGSRYPVVYVATGRYLGTTDLADSRVQSIYAMKDPLIDASYGTVRTNTNFVTQTITASGTDRTSTGNAVDWLTKSGWRADLPAGERVSVNPQVALETMYVGSNLPSSDTCTVGGQSFLYEFNIGTGASTSTYVGNVMIQGLTLVQLTTGAASGSVVSIITQSDGTVKPRVGSPPTSSSNLRRTSWRELAD